MQMGDFQESFQLQQFPLYEMRLWWGWIGYPAASRFPLGKAANAESAYTGVDTAENASFRSVVAI
jgi:hypothetical protein